jgi:hypothetical protein
MITKKSGYSPPQRIAVSPAKAWKDNWVRSYDKDGRQCEGDRRSSPKHNETSHHVRGTISRGDRED